MERTERSVLDGIEGLRRYSEFTEEEKAGLAEYERAMEEEAIPEMIQEIEERRRLARQIPECAGCAVLRDRLQEVQKALEELVRRTDALKSWTGRGHMTWASHHHEEILAALCQAQNETKEIRERELAGERIDAETMEFRMR